jgi:hypothetical protein
MRDTTLLSAAGAGSAFVAAGPAVGALWRGLQALAIFVALGVLVAAVAAAAAGFVTRRRVKLNRRMPGWLMAADYVMLVAGYIAMWVVVALLARGLGSFMLVMDTSERLSDAEFDRSLSFLAASVTAAASVLFAQVTSAPLFRALNAATRHDYRISRERQYLLAAVPVFLAATALLWSDASITGLCVQLVILTWGFAVTDLFPPTPLSALLAVVRRRSFRPGYSSS